MTAPLATTPDLLWPGMTFLERGWLSANNIVFQGPEGAALVDTGYCMHAVQTVALVRDVLGSAPLQRILNTHLHSDHCGGNAWLQATWPGVQTFIPPGQAQHVAQWNPHALSYTRTGQACPQFKAQGVLQPGSEIMLGGRPWQIHGAPGHDPDSVILFEPEKRLLISADALWANGFGVVFPEIEGVRAFHEVAATLDLIARLNPAVVLPGHGPIFTDVSTALTTARQRLTAFMDAPQRHARYAAKVLLKYKLLEWQQIGVPQLQAWCQQTSYMALLKAKHFAQHSHADWVQSLARELVDSEAATLEESDGGVATLVNR